MNPFVKSPRQVENAFAIVDAFLRHRETCILKELGDIREQIYEGEKGLEQIERKKESHRVNEFAKNWLES